MTLTDTQELVFGPYGPTREWWEAFRASEEPGFYDEEDAGTKLLLVVAAVARLALCVHVATAPRSAKAEHHRVMASEASPSEPLPPLVSRRRAEDAVRRWGLAS